MDFCLSISSFIGRVETKEKKKKKSPCDYILLYMNKRERERENEKYIELVHLIYFKVNENE